MKSKGNILGTKSMIFMKVICYYPEIKPDFFKIKRRYFRKKTQGISEADMQLFRKYLALFKSQYQAVQELILRISEIILQSFWSFRCALQAPMKA